MKKVGRPLSDNKRNREIRFRVTESEYLLFNEVSNHLGIPLSRFIRESLFSVIKLRFLAFIISKSIFRNKNDI